MPRRLSAAAIALAVLSACNPVAPSDEADVTIFAASSLRVVEDALGPATIVTDGSAALVAQLAEGAHADVLITADTAAMRRAERLGLVSDPTPLARNELVEVGSGGSLVMCDHQVPCGRASAELAEANRLVLQPVSLERSVGDVVGKIVSGEADRGWVYRTDALAADLDFHEIPHSAEHTTTVWIAPTTRADAHYDIPRNLPDALHQAGFLEAHP